MTTPNDISQIVGDLHAKLAAEGDADQIALKLEELGVTGYVGAAFSCVIAEFIRPHLPVTASLKCQVSVCEQATTVHAWENVETGASLQVRVDNPLAISDLINNFDHDKYPALIRND